MHKSHTRFAVLGLIIISLLAVAGIVSAGPPVPVWEQDFSVDSLGWEDSSDGWYGTITVGGGEAVFEGDGSSAPFSRFDHYRAYWPGDWTAEIDVYLDPSWPTGTGFDYSVAANSISNTHRRDYIFHVGVVENYGPITTATLLVNGSNNADFTTNPYKLVYDNGGNYYEVSTAGWYTLQHDFRNDGGVLAVDLNLLDSGGNTLWTATRSDVSDLIPSVVGGNRYAWFTHIDVPGGISVDDHELFIIQSTVDPTTANDLICDSGSVNISINDTAGIYGYQFKVTYDKTLVSATAVFDNTWFDPLNIGASPGGWQAQCNNTTGVCQFARTRGNPNGPLSGSGKVATINFNSVLATAADDFSVQVTDIVLSDIDGYPLPAASTSLPMDVCGTATVSGTVRLQGRPWMVGQNISALGEDFEVKLTGPYGPYTATPNFTTGAYTVTGVKFLPGGGSNYTIEADHWIYLKNAKTPLLVNGPVTGQNTRLLGGDANNDGSVSLADMSCIGGEFNTPSPWDCAGVGSANINADLAVNIQDLSIAGGNYGKDDPQGW